MPGFKKWGTLSLSLALVASIAAGCGSNNGNNGNNANQASDAGSSNNASASNDAAGNKPAEDLSPLKITFFDKNTGDAFTNDVAKEITKRTGITVEIQQPTGNPTEKLNLMLASDDLPDIVLMDRSGDVVNKYISTGALIPLNDLIDKYGPDVTKMYGDTLNKTRYTDGKNYYLSNWYGMSEGEPVFGFNLKMDFLKELAPDKAAGGQPFTADEFEQLLKDFKAKYPTVNGKPTTALTMDGSNMGAVTGTFKGMFGMKTYYETDGKLQYDVEDPKYKEMILYMNKLYSEGLIDTDWAINKKESWLQKLSSGTVFGTTGAYWDLGTANTALKKDGGEEKQFFDYKVVGPGVDPAKTTYGPQGSLGWDAIGITKANKNPERTMQFINFLASEEGQYLLQWGVEGKHWDMVDGKHVPKPEVLKGFKDDWNNYTKTTGIRKWTWFIKAGKGSDGTVYDLAGRYERSEIDKMAIKNLGDSVWNTDTYDNLGPQGGTPEALISQKVSDTMTQNITKAIIAKTPEEAGKVFDKMLADMKAAGSEKVEKIINDNYQARLALWK
ncbi:extracellular solute-binding protein [Paenibacillus sacheonensis]|uniref:Extracellular solute-binding protein n=1 Tax=Paenibacillus sacheonensis TaxID=742054 RepID=A0A7X4YNM4_9BACL|nr:extracellular solute-binding protein [Paenibacillus sacheonensis]MBM7565777.1 putative aldouronate transport system substrate-binding protein [Paenibacillus sacheonensis]NBC68901.1 extracellular solute-binding protein [Paenibacillus sacheonensis]